MANKFSDDLDWNIIYKIIEVISDSLINKTRMDTMDISDVFFIFKGINIYIDKFIHPKFIVTTEVESSYSCSAYDDYDAENGYMENEHNTENVYLLYKNMLNYIFRYAIKSLKNSYKDCLDSDLICLLEYVKFDIEQQNESNGPEEEDDF